MTSRSQSSAGLHPVPGNGGASPVFSRLLNDFARGQRLAIQLSRQGGSVLDAVGEILTPGVCRECGNDPTGTSPHAPDCSQHPDNIREAAMCRYCGQDHCVCEKRYGSVQGIVSRREAGRKA